MTEKNKPVFRQSDWNNLELVRQIVFYRLKNDSDWSQLDHTWGEQYGARFVEFEHRNLRLRFVVLVNEVMWQLISQGVISPGLNAHNPSLPFFHITDYGHKVLETECFIAHDPTGYLDEIRSLSGIVLGDNAIVYLEEALRCFNSGCHLAAVLLLGVASESVFLRLCDVIHKALDSEKEKDKFAKITHVGPKHTWLIGKYQRLDKRIKRELPESLSITLISLYDLIRRQRNDLGHPQEDPPELTREQAFVFFKLFPGFVQDMEAFAQHCQSHTL